MFRAIDGGVIAAAKTGSVGRLLNLDPRLLHTTRRVQSMLVMLEYGIRKYYIVIHTECGVEQIVMQLQISHM